MKEDSKGKLYSLTDRLKKEEVKEVAEIGEPTAALLIKYAVDEYLADEPGQQKLMRALEKKGLKSLDQEDILEFINELMSANGVGDDLEEEAETMDEEFGLVEILASLAHKTREQLGQEINEALASGLKKVKTVAADENEPAPVLKFPTK